MDREEYWLENQEQSLKIRVMGESENKKLLNKCINIISKKIK